MSAGLGGQQTRTPRRSGQSRRAAQTPRTLLQAVGELPGPLKIADPDCSFDGVRVHQGKPANLHHPARVVAPRQRLEPAPGGRSVADAQIDEAQDRARHELEHRLLRAHGPLQEVVRDAARLLHPTTVGVRQRLEVLGEVALTELPRELAVLLRQAFSTVEAACDELEVCELPERLPVEELVPVVGRRPAERLELEPSLVRPTHVGQTHPRDDVGIEPPRWAAQRSLHRASASHQRRRKRLTGEHPDVEQAADRRDLVGAAAARQQVDGAPQMLVPRAQIAAEDVLVPLEDLDRPGELGVAGGLPQRLLGQREVLGALGAAREHQEGPRALDAPSGLEHRGEQLENVPVGSRALVLLGRGHEPAASLDRSAGRRQPRRQLEELCGRGGRAASQGVGRRLIQARGDRAVGLLGAEREVAGALLDVVAHRSDLAVERASIARRQRRVERRRVQGMGEDHPPIANDDDLRRPRRLQRGPDIALDHPFEAVERRPSGQRDGLQRANRLCRERRETSGQQIGQRRLHRERLTRSLRAAGRVDRTGELYREEGVALRGRVQTLQREPRRNVAQPLPENAPDGPSAESLDLEARRLLVEQRIVKPGRRRGRTKDEHRGDALAAQAPQRERQRHR